MKKKIKNQLAIRKAKKNEKIDNLPKITILSEKIVKHHQYEIDVDDSIFDMIAKEGLKLIKNDKEALFNYAFLKTLENSKKVV